MESLDCIRRRWMLSIGVPSIFVSIFAAELAALGIR
jgi:hypothetical protein